MKKEVRKVIPVEQGLRQLFAMIFANCFIR